MSTQPEACKHERLRVWREAATGAPVALWSCADCERRFEPLDTTASARIAELEQQLAQAQKALTAARECILLDRTSLADFHMQPETNEVDEDGQAGLDEYDAVLAQIDDALSSSAEESNG